MEITEVSVSYSRTHSLPGYCNVRPGVTVTARVLEGDDPDEVMLDLAAMARDDVEARIDEALEDADEPPAFYRRPRYGVYQAPGHFLVLPDGHAGLPGGLTYLQGIQGWRTTRHRLAKARELARRCAERFDQQWVDCYDGAIPEEVLHAMTHAACKGCGADTPALELIHGHCEACVKKGESKELPF